jgi:polyhydroxyalkanoate synthesis regulator phasin
VLDEVRGYLQLAGGLTEMTAARARDIATSLLGQGRTVVPEEVRGLADDLVETSRNNREMLIGLIRTEVDRAVGRMGFVREDELAALRRHVQRLEAEIAQQRGEPAAKPAKPAKKKPAKKKVVKQKVVNKEPEA